MIPARSGEGGGRKGTMAVESMPIADCRPRAGAVEAAARLRDALGGPCRLGVVGPYYNRPTQPGLIAHFKALAEATALPICVYNIPARTGRNIEPETIVALAELPGIQMVKEATGSMDQASQVLAATDLTVLSGDDSMTLPLLAVGGRGVVSVVGNIVPADMRALCAAFDRGDLAEARRLHIRLFGLSRDLLGLASNPIPIKAAMAMLGRDSGEIRLPLVPLEAGLADKLRGVLRAYGLKTVA